MQTSERVRRGFWRIGLVGLWAGGIGAAAGSAFALYSWIFEPDINVYFKGDYVSAPVRANDQELTKILLDADTKKDWFAKLSQPEPEWRKGQLVPDVAGFRSEIKAKHERSIYEPLGLGMAALAIGAAWLGAWWVLGWIVRGFLA